MFMGDFTRRFSRRGGRSPGCAVAPPWPAAAPRDAAVTRLAPRANGPAAQTSDVALPRGGVSCGISGKSQLTRLSNHCRIQDGPCLPSGAAVGGHSAGLAGP